MTKNVFRKFYIGLIFLFLYAPIATMGILSFNDSRTRAKWGGLTLDWYRSLFRNEAIIRALFNTLSIALLAAIIATVIGTIACVVIMRMKKKTRAITLGVTNIPMLNAEIVTGISLMLLFIMMGLRFGYGTILLSHITFNIPYVILCILPRLRDMSPYAYEAALDLGANPVYGFFRVVLPEIKSGILAGFLMAFTLSIDDFIITHFTKGPGVDTLATKIYAEVKKGIKPEMYALSTLLFVVVLLLLWLANRTPQKEVLLYEGEKL